MSVLIRLSILFSFVACCTQAVAQRDSLSDCSRVRAAYFSWSQKDTMGALHQLEGVDHDYPENGLNPGAYLLLGQLYVALHQPQNAKKVLGKGLAASERVNCMPSESAGFSTGSISYYYSQTSKAAICLLLSALARADGDMGEELHFLTLADTSYISRFSCGNEIEDWKARISPRLAAIYLQKGDTAGALRRLCKFFLFDKTVAETLRPLLLIKYSPEQIQQEIKRCLSHPKKEQDYLIFSLFGYEITYSYDDQEKESKKYLQKNKRLLYLADRL